MTKTELKHWTAKRGMRLTWHGRGQKWTAELLIGSFGTPGLYAHGFVTRHAWFDEAGQLAGADVRFDRIRSAA